MLNEWVINEIGDISFGDKRLDKRAIRILSSLSQEPSGSIPCACSGWAETKAAYRFFDNNKVDSEEILSVHKTSTLNRVKKYKRVLSLQDTTKLVYTSQHQKHDVGPTHHDNDKGLLLHPTLVVSTDGTSLGVYDDYQWHRDKLCKHKGSIQALNNDRLHKLSIEEKESFRWLQGYRNATEIARLCPETEVVMVADRESELYDIYAEASKTEGKKADWLVRINKNRVLIGKDEKRASDKLYTHIEKQSVCQTIEFRLPKRNGEPGRLIKQTIRAATVTLHPPTGRRGNLRLFPVKVSVILAKEINPPAGKKPIQWWLMSSIELSKAIPATELINWYLCRWQIEVFFRVLKSGCRVEALQLTAANRFRPCIAFYLIVAWRIMYISSSARVETAHDCTRYFSEAEWQTAYLLKHKHLPKEIPSLKSIVKCIAMMGGYLARKRDSPPGPKAIWQGLSKVYNYLLVEETKKLTTYG